MASTEIDEAGVKAVTAMIERIRAKGFSLEARMFETVYWGWLRVTSAYVHGHPYVAKPEAPTMTPISALSVTDYTLNHWGPQIPGTPILDDAAVLNEAAADEAWHREEDRRMRREAGEDI
ncbi:hypothetical protein AB6806_27220 [Bosea sp. RCC_152_1]|uniref:hypothetical protein n=1 Tax=Bosea sp. RCC_152_1 TaxID=3239228 RepID=UPI0035264620